MLNSLKNFFANLIDFFIMIHSAGFDMIRDFSYDFQTYGASMAIIGLFLGIFLSLLALYMDVIGVIVIYYLISRILITIRTKKVERHSVVGTVINKKYEPGYMTSSYNAATKIMTPHYHAPVYNIYVEYDGVKKNFNSKELFEKYKENDSISLILIKNLDKHNTIIKQKLELPE